MLARKRGFPAKKEDAQRYFSSQKVANARHCCYVISEVKECDGTHSECHARDVPTLRTKRGTSNIKGSAEVTNLTSANIS